MISFSIAIDGGASDFGPWGECSKSCGGGRRSRERACIKPLPNDPGKGCDDLTEVEDCNVQPCPSEYLNTVFHDLRGVYNSFDKISCDKIVTKKQGTLNSRALLLSTGIFEKAATTTNGKEKRKRGRYPV